MRSERLEKYREERRRYLAKLDYIQARIKELDQKIMEGENLEIRALMRTENMTHPLWQSIPFQHEAYASPATGNRRFFRFHSS